MIILLGATLVATLAYVILIGFYLRHWQPGSADKPAELPAISVILAARNEAHQIRHALDALMDQHYPEDRFEVIVVDDQSEDNTPQIVRTYDKVRLLTNDGVGGKKQALALGMTHAKFPMIAVTDADCLTGRDWLVSLASVMKTDTQMVTGPVLLHATETAFHRFQGLDLASLAMVTGSGIQSGFHHLANGANMLFSKAAYTAVNGFSDDGHFASGDDVFLAQRIAGRFPGSIAYAWAPESAVYTSPIATAGAFIEQRRRWSGKNAHLPETRIYWIWAFIWVHHLTLLFSLIAAFIWAPIGAWIPVLCLLVKWGIDYTALSRITEYYRISDQMKGYHWSALYHFGYVLSMGFLSRPGNRYIWKGRLAR